MAIVGVVQSWKVVNVIERRALPNGKHVEAFGLRSSLSVTEQFQQLLNSGAVPAASLPSLHARLLLAERP